MTAEASVATSVRSLGEQSGIHLVEAGRPGHCPVFMLHGIGGSSASFAGQFSGLADEHHMIAWDAPGYGQSNDPESGLDMDGLADLAAECIASRFDDGAHVLGMSWGGVIATRIALRHPDLVRGLILGASTVGSGADPQKAASMRDRPAELERLGAARFAEQRARNLVANGASEERIATTAKAMATVIRPAGYSVAGESMAATDHTEQLGSVAAPTMVFWGSEDRVTGKDASIPLVGMIPGAVGVEVLGAGHLTNQDKPDHVNQWIASFTEITELLAKANPWDNQTTPPDR